LFQTGPIWPQEICSYRNPKILGKNREIDGTYVQRKRIANSAMRKGNTALVILSRVRPLIPQRINKHAPRGGVIRPIVRFSTMIKPK